MDTPITDSESLSEEPHSFEPPERGEVWAEWNFTDDGMGVTLYKRTENGPAVLDEAWLTNGQILQGNRPNIVLEE